MTNLFNESEALFTILYADYRCLLMNGKHLDNLITRMNFFNVHVCQWCITSNNKLFE